jgi:hypothetical protein
MEAENKMTCACGSVVLKKNLASHVKTKKHQALAGPPSLHRGVSFADAQHTDRADVEDDDDEGSEDEGDEDLDELFGIIEELTKAIFTLDKKLDRVYERVEELRGGVAETLLKQNLTLGEVRELSKKPEEK